MTKKVASFFPEKIGSAAPGEGPPLFFEQGPAESKSDPDSIFFLKFMPVELILAACTECDRPTFSSCRMWQWLRLGFYSASVLLAMQSAVLARGILSVRLSVTFRYCVQMNEVTRSCGFQHLVGQSLSFLKR